MRQPGFTLTKFTVALALLALLAVAIFIFADPAGRIQSGRNKQRLADVTQIMDALQRHREDTGQLPASIDTLPETVQIIGENPGPCTSIECEGQRVAATNCAITDFDTVLQPSIGQLPLDPKSGSTHDTRYFVNRNTDGTVTVGSCERERTSVETSGSVLGTAITR
ncbi:MAG TPA: hypothetical protein DEB30_05455 [Candidatus Peribacter riflensis]|uniref:Type II secretion system protein n=1 Tax=Candidatus Peribacter riflensis TaxID=1735162 RepID=A0A0S1SLZ3_9BACT|nr:MAG: hypothetical protein PeribacterA2_0105 [Candidatus Peribacter riflensis]OGJ76684.1 MAG: hypothetical protein A2398_03565 [Candidatus Peribacteria bacterium RIFOXYB1_FULL_57_12]OGJ78767.1 MAG: hypothetical protein A2412_02280 [Candidatus Peribacteria bacterium RIFOXYC1_FULL_58_8]ALM10603.1 MAG: hypothetical protein PeribacterB2_0105 [Candidatus Peribacter riflensis]ALM11705.1 MAG: hypothetical protein PeribacterC2_0104 [Candidatus Peribacter riflensis]